MDNKEKEIRYYIDDIYHARWEEGQIKHCPHPFMIKNYGHGGDCIVCLYTCKKCKHSEETPYCGALGCSYKRKEPEHGTKEK